MAKGFHNFAELDSQIMRKLNNMGAATSSALLFATDVKAAAIKLVEAEHARPGGNKSKDHFAFTESRIQALRKKGMLYFDTLQKVYRSGAPGEA